MIPLTNEQQESCKKTKIWCVQKKKKKDKYINDKNIEELRDHSLSL